MNELTHSYSYEQWINGYAKSEYVIKASLSFLYKTCLLPYDGLLITVPSADVDLELEPELSTQRISFSL
jgi:hypothetical protein